MISQLSLWVPLLSFLCCWGAVLFGMLALASPGELAADGRDTWLHVAAFAAMTITAWPLSHRRGWMAARLPLLLTLAVLLEWLQPQLQPTRHFSLMDVGANLAGVGLGWLAALGVWSRVGQWRQTQHGKSV